MGKNGKEVWDEEKRMYGKEATIRVDKNRIGGQFIDGYVKGVDTSVYSADKVVDLALEGRIKFHCLEQQ